MTFPGSNLPLRLIIFMLGCLLWAGPLAAQAASAESPDALLITAEVQQAGLGSFLAILEDPGGQMTIEHVLQPDIAALFTRSTQAEPGFGFTASAYWARFTIENRSAEPLDWYLEVGYPLIDQIDLYVPDGNGGQSVHSYGDLLPFANRPLDYRNIVFPLQEPANGSRTFLVRFQTSSSMNLVLNFWRAEQFLESSNSELIILGIYYGALLIMMIYNLLQFVVFRDRSYLYYVLFFTTWGLAQMSINGLAYQYLWPELTWWANVNIPFFIFAALFSFNLWALSNLSQADKARDFDRLFRFSQPVNALGMVLALTAPYALTIKAGTVMAAITAISWLIAAMIRSKHGQRAAGFFLVALGLYFIGVVLFTLKTLGVLPGNFITNWSIQWGAFAALVLFSFSTTDQALQVLRLSGERLEGQVRERTHQLEIEKKKSEDANKAKSKFLAYMSHEIRTPMNGILGMARLLKDTKLSEDQKKLTETICDSGDSLVNIVNDILDVSKLEARQLELENIPFRSTDLAGPLMSSMLPMATDKGLHLISDLDPTLPDVLVGDPFRLRQVLMNLVSNALKFTDEGRVTVRLKVVDGTSQEPEIDFAVKDTGVGISEEDRKKLFLPYSQATTEVARLHGGTGLGLMICRQMVELMGGTILLDSKPGQGSTFHFRIRLPVGSPEQLRTREMPDKPGHGLLAPLCVLQVEDNETNRDVVERILGKYGHEVISVANGREAMDLIAADDHVFGAIITDRHMPEMDGLETTRRIRAMAAPYSTMPILGITASVVANERQECLDAGMDRVLAKPVNESELLEALTELVNRQKGTQPGEQDSRRNLPVMVVDDTETNLELARRQLGSLGLAYELFQHPVAALAQARSGDYSVILLDYGMPLMNGIEFTQQLRDWERDRGVHTPVIAVSGSASPADRERYRAAGMEDCLEKPVLLSQLKLALMPWVNMDNNARTSVEQPARRPLADPQQPPVDIEMLADILGTDDAQIHKEMLELFVEHFKPLLKALELSLQAADRTLIRDMAHSAKSAASSAAATQLQALLEELEHKAEAGEPDWIKARFIEINSAFARVKQVWLSPADTKDSGDE